MKKAYVQYILKGKYVSVDIQGVNVTLNAILQIDFFGLMYF